MLVAGLAAIAAGSRTTTAASAAGGTTRVLDVTVTQDGVQGLPASIPGGEYTFEATQAGGAVLQLGRLRNGYTLAAARKDFLAAFGQNDLAATSRLFAGIAFEGGTSRGAHRTFTAYLTPGAYFTLGNDGSLAPFTVTTKGATPADPPTAGPTVVAEKVGSSPDRFAFHVQGPVTRSGTLRFKALSGDQPHFLGVAKLAPGASDMDCLSGSKDACTFLFDSGVVSPGQAMVFPYALPGAGRYLFACFIPDPMAGGQPHALLGLHKVVTVD